ncbi:hypothetical protein [Mycobacterium deserti]|uniref:Uncharacterized protein n=1 Tax=Mycobacterium deserti TaxID=2978347 RepID=A0ABT2MI70_9MYCO|nr:hypothetical protein [Mycobacterium deserti]MCT7660795.1 hypothetical protein [Mycobacterium deserti]
MVDLKKIVAKGAVVAVLGGSALGAGVVPANADPDRDDRGGGDWVENEWRGDWNDKSWDDDRWHKWWKVNKWRNDDRPPWGWGPPPAVHWRGHPPEWIDYWGYRVRPVWDPGYAAFGFWLFGVFIPVIVL